MVQTGIMRLQFWSEMPDLNLGSQAVRDEFDKIVDFWLDLGVDGFRLDAAKEYYSGSVDKMWKCCHGFIPW